jgi:cellulose biosynthesis protein BcsQ
LTLTLKCNVSQYILVDRDLKHHYSETSTKTIYRFFRSLSEGKDYGQKPEVIKSENFHLHLIAGDPRLALTEDLLAKDWGATLGGEIRGARTSVAFYELFQRCTDYDFILVDMGPALSSINRAVLTGADYFVSPMSSDLFSSKAIENIAAWYHKWHSGWKNACQNPDLKELKLGLLSDLKFAGYVTQQYVAKRQIDGSKRPVKAYEELIQPVEKIISDNFSFFSDKT